MKHKFKLLAVGVPGTRKSTFLRRLKAWMDRREDLSYKTIGEHQLEITYYDK